MGLFDAFRKQFIDVIDWTESGDGVLAYRYPMQDREIQNGAVLTVTETQVALFVNEGELADVFAPGRYTLTTNSLPVLTALKNWDKLFKSPFKSDVYFFSTREQIDQRWGTPNAIVVRDKELGPIRIRAHGTFSYRLKNPSVFFKKISGTRDVYTTEELQNQLRSVVLTRLATFLGGAQVAFLDMAANQMKFSDTLKEALAPSFEEYGLKLESYFVQSISLPEELQTHLDKVASMQMVGDLRKYAQFQGAEALGGVGKGGASDGVGAGVGMGAGMAMGQAMANALGGGQGAGGGPSDDPLATLNRLHELLGKGVISQAEFDAKKAELLKRIT